MKRISLRKSIFNVTVGIDIAQIHIYQNPEHHAGMTGRTAFGRILAVKFFKMYLFNDTVNDPERIVPKIKAPEHRGKSRLSLNV